jgi:hypothetical protein
MGDRQPLTDLSRPDPKHGNTHVPPPGSLIMASGTRHYTDFQAFWPFYVSQHMRPLTRILHWIGSTLGIVALMLLLLGWAYFPLNLLMILAGLIAGYGFAWVAHFVVEKNRPATFLYPWWSFVGDWKMWWLMTTGRMRREVEGVRERLDAGWTTTPECLVPPSGSSTVVPPENAAT